MTARSGLASAQIDALGSSLRHGGEALGVAPSLLKQVLEGGYWRDFTTKRQEEVHHDRFQSFVEAPPLRGLGVSMDLIERIVGTKDSDLLRLLREAKRVGKGRRSDLQPQSESLVSYTNTAAQADRLARDAPDLYERVRAGEMSINAASVEAGFRPRRISVRLDDPRRALGALLKHFSHEQLLTALEDAALLRAAQGAIADPENQGAAVPWGDVEAEIDH